MSRRKRYRTTKRQETLRQCLESLKYQAKSLGGVTDTTRDVGISTWTSAPTAVLSDAGLSHAHLQYALAPFRSALTTGSLPTSTPLPLARVRLRIPRSASTIGCLGRSCPSHTYACEVVKVACHETLGTSIPSRLELRLPSPYLGDVHQILLFAYTVAGQGCSRETPQ